MQIKLMPLKGMRLDGDTQIRSSLNTEKVVEYAEAMQEGDKFPPVVVFFDGSDHWLASGFHRYFAALRLGKPEIEAEVRQGTLDDAKDFACEDNARFGLPMTQEDRRNAVIRLLNSPNNNGWTNAEIARRVGVSQMTVGRIKASLQEKAPEPKTKTFTRKGKEVTVPTERLTRKKEDKDGQGRRAFRHHQRPDIREPETERRDCDGAVGCH
jgi:transcriptional regulator with XRE-family HTH domain